MSLNRFAARRDANEASIIDCARKLGWVMVQIGKPVDFIGYLKGCHLVEIKTAKGTLTKAQEKFIELWPGNVLIWRTTDDVVRATNWIQTGER